MNIICIQSKSGAANAVSHEAGNRITAREAAVLDLAHLTYQQIGEELGIGAETVRTHLKHARLKLGAESTRMAALLWERQQRRAA